MASSSTTTPTPEDKVAPSTRPPAVAIGDVVLVRVDEGLRRPMIVTFAGLVSGGSTKKEFRLSGTLCCEPDDYSRPIFRGAFDRTTDPARFHGRPSKVCPVAYGEFLAEGSGLGQWITRPTNSPAGS